MTKPAQRRHTAKLHWWHRGRADALVAIAGDLGWKESFTYAQGRRIDIDAGDTHEALTRARAFTAPVPSTQESRKP